MFALAAGLATVFGLALAPVAMLPVLGLAGAIAFAGLPRVALTAIVVLTLAGVAELRVDASERPPSPVSGARR